MNKILLLLAFIGIFNTAYSVPRHYIDEHYVNPVSGLYTIKNVENPKNGLRMSHISVAIPSYYIKVKKLSEDATTITVQFELSSAETTAFDASATVKITGSGGVDALSYLVAADGFIGGSSAPLVMRGVSPFPTTFKFTKNSTSNAVVFTIDDAASPNGYGVFSINLGLAGLMAYDVTKPTNCIITPSVSILASATTICAGLSTTFTATPTRGGTTPTYQWYKGSSPIINATSSTYTSTSLADNDQISVVMTADLSGTYSCVDATFNGGITSTSNVITITVNPIHTITLSSAAATESQTACINTALTSITYSLGGGATGATVTGLPSGVTATVNGTILTISGTPTVSGSFNYSIATTGNACTIANKSGTITVNPNHVITLSSATATKNQALCINTALTPITYTLAGGATDADVSNLPSGVTASVSGATLTISGTPTNSGAFNYSITTKGNTCTVATESGTINVSPTPVGGTVAITTGTAIVCSGTNSTVLTLSGHTGDIAKWQSSTDVGFTNPTDIANTTTTLTATDLTTTTYYRAVIQSGACSTPANSVSAVITVNPTSVGGTIAGSTTVCSGTNNTVLTLSGHTGNIVKWQSSINADFSNPSDITNPATNLTATNLTTTTYYRAVVQSGVCPSTSSGNGTITVTPLPTASIGTTATTICSGTTTTITFNGTPNAVITYKIDGGTDLTTTLNSAGTVSVTTSALTTTSTLTTTYTLVSVSEASSLACTATISGQSVVITTSACASTLAAKIYIEGAYNTITNLMNDGLRINNLIPANQPYNTLIFSGSSAYLGTETVTSTVLGVTGLNAIVDWVFIELREENNRSRIVQSRAALLQSDGDIVDVDGVSPVKFNGLVDGNYHVAIRHRLCLATRTATAVPMFARPTGSNTSAIINFTNNSNALVGSQKELKTGIYGLFIGDTDRNGQINAGDVSEVRLNNPTPFNLFNYLLKGYDMDFNGNIFSSDVAIIRPNNPKDQVDLGQ